MAISTKYGKVDIPKIGSDEPVFILRAQDRLAEEAIGMYRVLAKSRGSKISDSLEREMDAFHNWSGNKKLPD
jgi:hypothetical protein